MGDGVGEKSGHLWWPEPLVAGTHRKRGTPKASKVSSMEGGRISAEDLTDQTDLVSFLWLTLEEWLKPFWGVFKEKHPGYKVAKEFYMNCRRDGKDKIALGRSFNPEYRPFDLKEGMDFSRENRTPRFLGFILKVLEVM